MEKTFDFTQFLNLIETKGKELYHEGFKLFPEDYETIYKLLVYFLKDEAGSEKYNISFRKGILLSGPVGCGKTSLMNILRHFRKPEERYILKSCRDISFEFIHDGYSVIQKYSRSAFNHDTPKSYCFDDLGTENNLKYYGNNCNIMTEILLSRYDLFITRGMITHLTTNLDSNEIEDLYGLRVRSRMREQFNLIAFDGNSMDKRT